MSAAIDIGTLRILNVGLGDLKITFRPDASDEERKQAREMVERMLRDGYTLLVERSDGTYTPCKGFDAKTSSYIVSELPSKTAIRTKNGRRKKGKRTKVAAGSTRAVSVARTAGG